MLPILPCPVDTDYRTEFLLCEACVIEREIEYVKNNWRSNDKDRELKFLRSKLAEVCTALGI